jgi:hypothetical protein
MSATVPPTRWYHVSPHGYYDLVRLARRGRTRLLSEKRGAKKGDATCSDAENELRPLFLPIEEVPFDPDTFFGSSRTDRLQRYGLCQLKHRISCNTHRRGDQHWKYGENPEWGKKRYRNKKSSSIKADVLSEFHSHYLLAAAKPETFFSGSHRGLASRRTAGATAF